MTFEKKIIMASFNRDWNIQTMDKKKHGGNHYCHFCLEILIFHLDYGIVGIATMELLNLWLIHTITTNIHSVLGIQKRLT